MVYPALIPLMRAPRLPVVEWTDAPSDLNGLVILAERGNLVSARVSSHFNRSLPILCRKLLPASHQYETLEQIHPTACSHIPNSTGLSHMNIPHTHYNTQWYSLLEHKTSFHDKNWKVNCNTDFTRFPNNFLKLYLMVLLLMELTNKAGFYKQHKVIHFTFNECSTYRISTDIANNSYRQQQQQQQQQGTYSYNIFCYNRLITKQHGLI